MHDIRGKRQELMEEPKAMAKRDGKEGGRKEEREKREGRGKGQEEIGKR